MTIPPNAVPLVLAAAFTAGCMVINAAQAHATRLARVLEALLLVVLVVTVIAAMDHLRGSYPSTSPAAPEPVDAEWSSPSSG